MFQTTNQNIYIYISCFPIFSHIKSIEKSNDFPNIKIVGESINNHIMFLLNHMKNPLMGKSWPKNHTPSRHHCGNFASCAHCESSSVRNAPTSDVARWASLHRWIGLREHLNRKPMAFYHKILRDFRLKFSHHPILWFYHLIRIIDW